MKKNQLKKQPVTIISAFPVESTWPDAIANGRRQGKWPQVPTRSTQN